MKLQTAAVRSTHSDLVNICFHIQQQSIQISDPLTAVIPFKFIPRHMAMMLKLQSHGFILKS